MTGIRGATAVLVFLGALRTGQTQPSLVEVRGKVLDPSHAPISGAVIRQMSSPAKAAISGQDGEFLLMLAPGSHAVEVTAEGFGKASESINVANGTSQPLEIILQIAGVRNTITVTEDSPYAVPAVSSGTRTLTTLRDLPQSITVVNQEQMRDQMMMSIGDVVRYVPGISAHQGENNRDQVIIRGNSSSADFFVNGVRDDVQYYRDLYNLEQVEALKGPNAMMFGRGGGGGVINRVTKEAVSLPFREVSLSGGSFGDKRFSADFNQPINAKSFLRLNGMYENSGSFRKAVDLERYGIAPALTIAPGSRTKITLSYERFHDGRTADRGISSYQGRPADVPTDTYFGNPDDSRVRASVNMGSVALEHFWGRLTIRNRTLFGGYDRGYQNYVPGAISPDRSQVSLSAYNNATSRLNLFNQTDVTYSLRTGPVHHTLLMGAEAGRQLTDNFRNTGYFNGTSTSILAPLDATLIKSRAEFRQSATDADNHVTTLVSATYLQDQVELSPHFEVVAGIRFDRFDLRFQNNRNGDHLRRTDNLVSPRVGFIFKPAMPVSLYWNYSVSHLPSAGDQFSSLTTVTQQVKPEKFQNYEAGVKWDVHRDLALTMAVYRLDRSNTRSTDPNDPTRIVQTGSQRSNGFELGWNGKVTRSWRVAGGYAYQDVFVTSATTAARAGAQAAQVPHHSFSLWNHYQIRPRWGAGIGVLNRTRMFAAIDDAVVLPGYLRADAAVYYSLTERVRVQGNIENLFNRRYYLNADSNTNISPGASRTVRVGLVARF